MTHYARTRMPSPWSPPPGGVGVRRRFDHAPEPTETDWRTRAACREEPPELFFPIGNTGPALQVIAEAKAVCRRCPVMMKCRTWALETGQEHGVWGGMSEDERRAFKRRAQRNRARQVAA